jgi:hypothetical protein
VRAAGRAADAAGAPSWALLAATLGLWACTIPDTEGGLETFLGATEDARVRADVSLPDAGGGGVDISGDYLFGVQTPLGGPILFAATVAVTDQGETEVFDLTLQPLASDLIEDEEPRPNAREAVGDPTVVADVPLAEGAFSFEVLGLAVPAEANPVAAFAIVADLTFQGVVLSAERFCGTVSGTLVVPVATDLAGSTFAAVRTADVTTETPEVTCP